MKHKYKLYKWGNALLAGLLAVFLAGSLSVRVHASGTAYYVSLTGSDTNPGTQAAPFRTFTKATSVLMPGDQLYIYGGVYNQAVWVKVSGVAGSPITVLPVPGQSVVIDLLNQAGNNVYVTGSYVIVQGLELRNSNQYCVRLLGTHNVFRDSVVHDCNNMGIITTGQDEQIIGNTVYHASLKSVDLSASNGQASGIKVSLGAMRVLIANNTVYNNYGEGICVTRGANVTVRSNVSYDNLGPNIYIDNSYNVVVERNFTYNHPNNGFEKNGVPSSNISIGEEYYSGWGAQLSNITVVNNIALNGKNGVVFWGNTSGTAGGGLKYATIAFNTLWGSVSSEIRIAYDTGQTGNLIANNIVQQPAGKLVSLDNPAGVTFSHNFWVNVLPPQYARAAGDGTGDPKLASVPGFDPNTFRLNTGSPAIDAASVVTGISDDYAGGPRPFGAAPDMGAFEFGAVP